MKPQRFQREFVVPASAIDVRNHVNNLEYLQWCLDIAESHWDRNTNPELRSRYIWYVLKHEISYKAAAFEGDKLRITTWVEYSEGVRSERRYNIARIKDNKLLVEASTLWCLLDAHSQRPTQITEEIRNLFSESDTGENNQSSE